ncbi:MAG: hypothetical protein IKZ01_04840 [Anaerotignum sp.]|nr:hypothetical protein [Anaerotignum sp.]
MKEVILGTIAFILYMVYDLEQAGAISHRFHKMVKGFFTIGSVLLLISTVSLLRKIIPMAMPLDGNQIVSVIFAGLFLILLIYTLFFALPFETTYVAQDAHKTYDKKMYALCRHPGVLWFAGFYICLWLAFGTKPMLVMAVWFSFLNFCYIILQDRYTFPKIFSDYGDYQKSVPFLIPNGKSLKRCLDTFKESR